MRRKDSNIHVYAYSVSVITDSRKAGGRSRTIKRRRPMAAILLQAWCGSTRSGAVQLVERRRAVLHTRKDPMLSHTHMCATQQQQRACCTQAAASLMHTRPPAPAPSPRPGQSFGHQPIYTIAPAPSNHTARLQRHQPRGGTNCTPLHPEEASCQPATRNTLR